MKISGNITIFTGASYQGNLSTQEQKETAGSSLFAGNLNQGLFADRVSRRRKEAREEAMKVIGEAFAGDRAIDEDLEARRVRVDELTAENFELQKKIDAIDEEQARLKETYGVTEDSREQQELELLRKSENALMRGTLTPGELEQVAEIKKRGLTEYQQRQLELDDLRAVYLEKKVENSRAISTENAIINETKMERLKFSPMAKAKKQAEEILEAAHREIMSMALEESKKQIDEESEAREEQAEKIEAEREEQEQYIEERREESREQEELLEEMAAEEILEMDQLKTEVQKEVQAIVDKMKLLAEDIKGAAVDSSV